MKMRTNLAQPVIQKILKTLESRRLVKSVKNINNPSRKVFMLFELEPSREVTGGAWYTENQVRKGGGGREGRKGVGLKRGCTLITRAYPGFFCLCC